MDMPDKKTPKVSIITVCLNSEDNLETAIKSVSGQTYPDIEYIIIDGGSTDGSKELFQRYRGRIDKILIEKDSGIYDAMNKGIKLSSGEIIYFLNSDDKFYDTRVVEDSVGAFLKNIDKDFIYGNIEVFDPLKNISCVESYPARISKLLFIRKTIAHPATFFRRSSFERAGYFDDRFKIAADYEWFLRALYVAKLTALHIKRKISVFKLGGISTNPDYAKFYFKERRAIQKKYFNPLERGCANLLYKTRELIRK